jgi:Cys-tRNA(Pro)/Cys-tRNA(Cys) deacylase
MTKAIQYLSDHKIPFKLFHHVFRPTSLENAAQQRGQSPDQVVRSILFRISGDEFLMVLVPGPKQISWKLLRLYLNVNRISLATPDEVFAVTGYRIGAVSPFGISPTIRILIQTSITALTEISIGSGEAGVAVIIQVSDLLAALPGAEFLDLWAGVN